jgi:phospholipid methyltransferase
MLRTWATAYLRTEIVHDSSQHSEALVADGPFRYVRNPLYLANLPMVAGIGVMASRLGWLFMFVGTWVFVYRLIRREEDALLESQGESYRAYLQAVPRFWPALAPRVPSAGGQPRWGQAIGGEAIFWLFGVAVLCFAFTLNIKLIWIVFGAGFAFYFIVVPLIGKRAAASGTNPECTCKSNDPRLRMSLSATAIRAMASGVDRELYGFVGSVGVGGATGVGL